LPAGAAEARRRRRPAGAGDDDEQVDGVVVAVTRHPVEVLQAAPVSVEEEGGVVLLGHRERASRQPQSSPRLETSRTGSTCTASLASQLSSSPSCGLPKAA